MKTNWALICLSLLTVCTQANDALSRKADAYLQARTDAGEFSGTVLLARDGRTLFAKGYGFANEEWRIPNDVHTRFPVASITKTFTAALVLKLRQQGKLALEDPLCKHLSPCPKPWEAITLRHLLMHRAGVPEFAKDAEFLRKVRQYIALPDLIAVFRDRALDFPAGSRYSYSNSNYILLGAVIEKAGGKSYGTLLRELLFQPLGMRNSGLDDSELILANRASGYRPRQKNQGKWKAKASYVDSSWLFSAGGVYSTVGDLLIWEKALRTGAVLPPAEVAQMWSTRHGDYGYGWQLLAPSPKWLNRRVVFHAGGLTGFATDLLIYPEERVAVVVLANLLPVPLADIARDLSAMTLDAR